MITANKERRKYSRIEARYILGCQLFSLRMNTPREQGTSRNISANGILFESSVVYAIGDVVRLELHIPGWEKYKTEFYKAEQMSYSTPCVALGRVVRVEQKNGRSYEIGIHLIGIDSGHQEALARYLASVSKK